MFASPYRLQPRRTLLLLFALIGPAGAAQSNSMTYRNRSLQTLFLWPQTGGWLLGRSHTPKQQRQKGQRSKSVNTKDLNICLFVHGSIYDFGLFVS